MLHPAFHGISPARRHVPKGYVVRLLGSLVQARFFNDEATAAQDFPERDMETAFPGPGEDFFEYADVIEAIRECPGPRFTMMELGAGYGRWLTETGCAVRALRPELARALVGVEAEPTHFAWMHQAVRDNDLNGPDCVLVHAAVGGHEGREWFITGCPGVYYGQKMLKPGQRAVLIEQLLSQGIPKESWPSLSIAIEDAQGRALTVRPVPVITLSSLLAGYDHVDLIHMDIQELEADVVEECIDALNHRVRRVHIGTHSPEVEARLRVAFTAHGWDKLYDFPSRSVVATPFGEATFQDGVQTWLNPRLAPAG